MKPFRNFESKSIYSPELDLDLKFLEMGDYQWIKIEGLDNGYNKE